MTSTHAYVLRYHYNSADEINQMSPIVARGICSPLQLGAKCGARGNISRPTLSQNPKQAAGRRTYQRDLNYPSLPILYTLGTTLKENSLPILAACTQCGHFCQKRVQVASAKIRD